jgi:hypothetical protein
VIYSFAIRFNGPREPDVVASLVGFLEEEEEEEEEEDDEEEDDDDDDNPIEVGGIFKATKKARSRRKYSFR